MIEIPKDKLREAYWYLMHNKYGYQEDLDKIHPMMSLYLIKEGTIGEGINSKAQLRYHVTKLGEDISQIQYIELTRKLVYEELNSRNNV